MPKHSGIKHPENNFFTMLVDSVGQEYRKPRIALHCSPVSGALLYGVTQKAGDCILYYIAFQGTKTEFS